MGSGALSGKMLLVRNVENNKIGEYLTAGQVKQVLGLPHCTGLEQILG